MKYVVLLFMFLSVSAIDVNAQKKRKKEKEYSLGTMAFIDIPKFDNSRNIGVEIFTEINNDNTRKFSDGFVFGVGAAIGVRPAKIYEPDDLPNFYIETDSWGRILSEVQPRHYQSVYASFGYMLWRFTLGVKYGMASSRFYTYARSFESPTDYALVYTSDKWWRQTSAFFLNAKVSRDVGFHFAATTLDPSEFFDTITIGIRWRYTFNDKHRLDKKGIFRAIGSYFSVYPQKSKE